MRNFLSYWLRCAKHAARGNVAFANDWQWLFGIPAISGVVVYLTAQRIGVEWSATHPIAAAVAGALFAFLFTWLVAFFARLLNAPVAFDLKSQWEIARLEKVTAGSINPSFKVFIEAIEDRDRDGMDSENLFRAGITNLDPKRTFVAYAVLEDVDPALHISPAARLTFMGKGADGRECSIAPSETAYALLILREKVGSFHDTRDTAPYVAFGVSSSHESSVLRAVSSILHDHEGALAVGSSYRATLAVHAAGGISQRLAFSAFLSSDGTVSVVSD